MVDVITYPCWDESYSVLLEGLPVLVEDTYFKFQITICNVGLLQIGVCLDDM